MSSECSESSKISKSSNSSTSNTYTGNSTSSTSINRKRRNPEKAGHSEKSIPIISDRIVRMIPEKR